MPMGDEQHDARLGQASMEMGSVIGQARATLGALRDQGTTMKGTKRRLLDIATTLGLSNTLMRLIEQRTAQDKIVLWGGMLVTLVAMYFIWSYFKG